jgi:fructokinase
LILVIGEILFDLFPKFKRIGGAPFNFAYHLKNFGFPVRFISRVGRDANGKEILDRIQAAGFNPSDVQLDDTHSTGTVDVQLDEDGIPEFHITPDVAFDYIEFIPELYREIFLDAELVYFGTLAQRTPSGLKEIQRFLGRKQPATLAFCDLNLRRDSYADSVINASLQAADILKISTDELGELKQIAEGERDNSAFIGQLMATYALNMVALTQGAAGSDLYTQEGLFHASSEPVELMVDTVGAGDAYAAMLAVGILKNWPHPKTLAMAAAFAARICTIEGAIPESAGFYEPIGKQMENGA